MSISWTVPSLNTDGTPLTDIGGYRLSYGTTPTGLSQSILLSDGAVNSYTITGLAPGTYYIGVATLNAAGEASVVSSVASKTLP